MLSVAHQEYKIVVSAPMDRSICQVPHCRVDGEHALWIENDRGLNVVHFDPICGNHLMWYVLNTLVVGTEEYT